MRVMMIGLFPPSPDRIDGGVAAAVTYLSQALVINQGVDLIGVRICTSAPVNQNGNAFNWPIVDLPLTRLGLSTLYCRERRLVRRLVREWRPDIVHAQGVDPEGWLSLDCGVPVVVTVHGLVRQMAMVENDAVKRVRGLVKAALIERPTVRRSRELISISPYVIGHYGRNISARVHEIPNAVSSFYFGVRRAPERGRFLFAGRVIPRKGVVDIVRAAALHPQAVTRLVLAGTTPDRTYETLLRKEVEAWRLTPKVEFAGLLDEARLLDQFARAEALILPSYQETAPMVIQQAMAAGLAVVASRVGGVPHQLDDEVNGLLHDVGDVKQLAAALRRLHDDPTLSARLGAAGKAKAAAHFAADRVARTTRAAYDLILGGHSNNG